jgi:hypothetical protein
LVVVAVNRGPEVLQRCIVHTIIGSLYLKPKFVFEKGHKFVFVQQAVWDFMVHPIKSLLRAFIVIPLARPPGFNSRHERGKVNFRAGQIAS